MVEKEDLENEEKSPILCQYRHKVDVKQLMLYLQSPATYKTELANFVYNRLYERYIEPFFVLEHLKSEPNLGSILLKIEDEQGHKVEDVSQLKVRSGFSIMANMCLLIETMQSFRYGLNNNSKENLAVFNSFFSESNTEKVLGKIKCNALTNEETGFYACVRCGILHKGETLKGWKIHNKHTEPINPQLRTINAQKFLQLMRSILAGYKQELIDADMNTLLWNNYLLKLHTIIKNCESPLKLDQKKNQNKLNNQITF